SRERRSASAPAGTWSPTRPRESRPSVAMRVSSARGRASSAEIGAMSRAWPVTAAIDASTSHGSYPSARSSQSESAPAVSSARASARSSRASANRPGSRTPIWSADTLHLGREHQGDAERQASEQHEAGREPRASVMAGGSKAEDERHQGSRQHEHPQKDQAPTEQARSHGAERDEEE